jgi:hypothetical protein
MTRGWLFGHPDSVEDVVLSIEEEIEDAYIEAETTEVIGICAHCGECITEGEAGYYYDGRLGYVHDEGYCPEEGW